jgi:hypothetical protein
MELTHKSSVLYPHTKHFKADYSRAYKLQLSCKIGNSHPNIIFRCFLMAEMKLTISLHQEKQKIFFKDSTAMYFNINVAIKTELWKYRNISFS